MGWTCLTYVDLSSQMNAENQVGNDWQPIMAFMHKVVFSFSSSSCLKQKVNWIVGSHNFLDTLSIQAEENRRRLGRSFYRWACWFFWRKCSLEKLFGYLAFFADCKKGEQRGLICKHNKQDNFDTTSVMLCRAAATTTHFFAAIML